MSIRKRHLLPRSCVLRKFLPQRSAATPAVETFVGPCLGTKSTVSGWTRVNKATIDLHGDHRLFIKIAENKIFSKPNGRFPLNGIIPTTGPFIFLRPFYHSCSDRIQVYIAREFLCILISFSGEFCQMCWCDSLVTFYSLVSSESNQLVLPNSDANVARSLPSNSLSAKLVKSDPSTSPSRSKSNPHPTSSIAGRLTLSLTEKYGALYMQS